MKGRQVHRKILQHFKISNSEGSLLEFEYLMSLQLVRQDLRKFQTDWDEMLASVRDVPGESVLEPLYLAQLEQCAILRGRLLAYEFLEPTSQDKTYEALHKLVDQILESRRRKAQLNERSKSPGPSNLVLPATEDVPDKGVGRIWKKSGNCSYGDRCFHKRPSEDKRHSPKRPRKGNIQITTKLSKA